MARTKYKTLKAYCDAQPRAKNTATIASEMQVGVTTLYQWLNGNQFPSREIALRLSRDLSISLEGLLDPESQQEKAS